MTPVTLQLKGPYHLCGGEDLAFSDKAPDKPGVYNITPEEARTLDVDFGLKVTMPPEWTFDEGDIRARLRHAGIEIEEP